MAAILLIDDDAYFRKAVVPALQSRQHEVVEATRCGDADALLSVRKFDLIIIDGLLPDMDGVTWTERYRMYDSATPVIFVSAFWKNEPRLKKLKLAGTIKKPVDIASLVSKVENTLRASGADIELSDEALAGLAALRKQFEAELPTLIAGIRDAILQLRKAPGSAPVRGVAIRRVHQVAGTAGSFGFDKVGDACARLEDIIRRFTALTPSALTWLEIDNTLALLGPAPEAQKISA